MSSAWQTRVMGTWWWLLLTAHELNLITKVAICTHTEAPQRRGGNIARTSTCSSGPAEQYQGPVCMWQSLELDYIFMGWMDRQEGWGGTRCLGSEKADLLGISKETVSPRSQTPLAQEM